MRVYLQEAFEKIAADEAIGDAQFAAINAAKLDALIASVEAEINEGKTLPMFDERGEFIERNEFKDNQSLLQGDPKWQSLSRDWMWNG
jgi:hypothetical protein